MGDEMVLTLEDIIEMSKKPLTITQERSYSDNYDTI